MHGDILIPKPDLEEHSVGSLPWDRKSGKLYWVSVLHYHLKNSNQALKRGLSIPHHSKDPLAIPINRLLSLCNSSHLLQSLTVGNSPHIQATTFSDAVGPHVDIAFTGCDPAYNCSETKSLYPFVSEAIEQWEEYKFVLDIDSSQHSFRQLLLSGSLVFRASIFEEFWTLQARPFVHYIPVQPDFSDLPSLLQFFLENDHLAKKIALEGQKLAKECFGRTGVKAGLLAVLGEYGRMWNEGVEHEGNPTKDFEFNL